MRSNGFRSKQARNYPDKRRNVSASFPDVNRWGASAR